jgi:hypothetical protein
LPAVRRAGKNRQTMKNRTNATKQAAPVSGFHAVGRVAYHRAANTGERLKREEAKLHRRIKLICKPQGVLGDFLLILKRRKLVIKLRKRFRKPEALFIRTRGWNIEHRTLNIEH